MGASTVPPTAAAPGLDGTGVDARLGIDQPPGWWPAVPRLKSYEAAGFRHLQFSVVARELLRDDRLIEAHASALGDAVGLTGLSLIIHAPGELSAGTPDQDAEFRGALRYAALAGAAMLVYHGMRVPVDHPQVRRRLALEEHSLRRLMDVAGDLGVGVAIENLAPSYPGPEFVCHCPQAIAELVRRLDCEHVGMCLDIGHAHVVAGYKGCELRPLIEPVLDRVTLFHVHDNFGARPGAPRAGGIEPVRLHLHLAPGAGTVPWAELAGILGAHAAPLCLEVQPSKRPPPATLAIVMREVLGLGRRVSAGS
jgi:sugar phosphate isomerase/epimerase